MTLAEFEAKYTGAEGVGDTLENTGQCVGLIEAWLDQLGTPHIWGNAKDLMTNADRGAYDVVLNTPDGIPSPGDVFCFDGYYGGGVGHTGLVVSADVNQVTLFQQNDPEGSTPHLKSYTYDHALGWIHPKISNQGDEGVITDADNEYGRWNKLFYQIRGRAASRQEFQQAAVGQTWLHAMEILSDSTEADAATHNQEVGSAAVKDNWQGQIAALTVERDSLKARVARDVADAGALKKQLADAAAANQSLTADLEVAKQQLAKLSAPGPQTSPQPVVDPLSGPGKQQSGDGSSSSDVPVNSIYDTLKRLWAQLVAWLRSHK